MKKIKYNNFIVQIILIIIAGIVSVLWQKCVLLGSNVGFVDLFIYGNTYGNIIMDVFAPLIAILCLNNTFVEEMQNSNSRKDIFLKSLKKGVSSGLAFVIGLSILLLLLFIYNASLPKVTININGAFSDILILSKVLYIIAFIVHSFIYGLIYTLFGAGLAVSLKNRFFFFFTPVLINQLSLYTPYLFPSSILKQVLLITPELPYDVLTNPNTILGNLFDLFFIGIIGVVLMLYKHRNITKERMVKINE